MRKQLCRAGLVLLASAALAACTPGGGGDAPSPTATAPTGTSTASATATPSPDTETTQPAPSPSGVPLPSGSGQGHAELAIMIKPSATGAPSNFTLVCQDGLPAAESNHPDAAVACGALKDNPAILSPAPPAKDQMCTQQYGGPQQATVTGVVDGYSVNATFSLSDGCEIANWNAAKAVLGSSGGAG
ncbi:SSI family serine proteinase inhibitor [Arthrobacter oryzae]|uniref:Serine protease inhibitor n=1 Tax=Arthrobacter oryzae TaxID=409290 RepID=A0A3N0BMF9_9MICC|nr:SSI family serine proteinase inhibitor [Arthrobacter oryzae]RNL49953.1 serine protease inhibitor [Arthrobacter oryzae]